MRWIWQQPDWPDFRYDKLALEHRELEFRLNSERLAGSFDALPMASQEDATIDLMLSEAIKTSAIEGEDLEVFATLFDYIGYATGELRPEVSRSSFAAGGHSQELANISDA
jgi:Fic family protein